MHDIKSTSPRPLDAPSRAAVDRRTFLKYVGAGAAAIVGTQVGPLSRFAGSPAVASALASPWVDTEGRGLWSPPPYPVPLPGDAAARTTDRERLAAFEVIDDLVLPEGWTYRPLAVYGDVYGPADDPGRQVRFGYNNDYTGLLPIAGKDDEFWLFVNHEYVSARPWLAAYEEVFGEAPPAFQLNEDSADPPLYRRGILSIEGWSMPGNAIDVTREADWNEVPAAVRATIRANAQRLLSQVGVSVLHVRRVADGTFEVVRDSTMHKRITAIGRENVGGGPSHHSRFTGPAARLFDRPPRGTMSNCSGGTTPWGTFLTCEENFYADVPEDVSPGGRPLTGRPRWWGARGDRFNGFYVFDNPTPSTLYGNGNVLEDPLDGREFGWVCEVDPMNGHLTKHTALGRFRHENVTLRVEAGKRLAAYMGDDRRGGHVWKFVSDHVVTDPKSPANSRLLRSGTLYVARFDEDYTGRWIPIVPSTPLRLPEPEMCPTQHIQVPLRPAGGSVSVGDTDRDNPDIEVERWVDYVERFTDKPFAECTLGDLVKLESAAEGAAAEEERQGVLLMDAFLMANAVGGTPSARPEDLEVHPLDGTIYIAFTDATGSGDGSPDTRVFPDSKLENSRQYGAIYRILEGGLEGLESDPAATFFSWGKLVSSGEVASRGGGFACADNMVFDPTGNLWMVTDISTSAQNFPTTRDVVDGTTAGAKYFPGVFGNNAMFMIPTDGPRRGEPQLFATAPMEAEFCGPTFSEDGETLILAIQHPGEESSMRRKEGAEEIQTHVVHDRDDRPFEQRRKVPVGSNFPHGERDRAPRPAVVSIVRTKTTRPG
ncbi:MAG: alkaline phosphatase PhoX [Acidobacteriota bacterium]